jgi:hypothetical protein
MLQLEDLHLTAFISIGRGASLMVVHRSSFLFTSVSVAVSDRMPNLSVIGGSAE